MTRESTPTPPPASTGTAPLPDPQVLHAAAHGARLELVRTLDVARRSLWEPAPRIAALDRLLRNWASDLEREVAVLVPALDVLGALESFEDALSNAKVVLQEQAEALDVLRGALRACANETDVLRVERLLSMRRDVTLAETEHADLKALLVDAEPYLTAFQTNARRRAEAVAVAWSRWHAAEIGRRLARLKETVLAVREAAKAGTPRLQALAQRWEARGQPVPVPTMTWPSSPDPFAPPTLVEESIGQEQGRNP